MVLPFERTKTTRNSPLRVLHLYAGNLFGGIETLLSTLASCRNLCPEMEPSFGLCFQGRIFNELKNANVPVFDLEPVRWSRPWTVIRARRRLKSILQNHLFDVVVTHANWPHAVFAPAVRKAKLPLVNFVHDAIRTLNLVDRFATMTPPNLVIANSEYSSQFVKNVFPGTGTEVINLPIQCDFKKPSESERTALRRGLATSDDSVVIIQVSRMESWKGAHRTLAALGSMKRIETPWTAWFVGGSQRPQEIAYENSLKQLARDFGIVDKVRFLGQRSDVPNLLGAADIFCQPNISPEPFGIVFIEALAAGLPVVTSNVGGGAEIVNASCGRLVSSDVTEELSSALLSLFDPPSRPTSQNCMLRARRLCSAETQIRKYHTRLAELVATI